MAQAIEGRAPFLTPFQGAVPEVRASRDASSYPAARRLGVVMVGILILVAPVGITALHMRAYPTYSPLDEGVHLDSVRRAVAGEIVHPGDRVGDEILVDVLCRGVDYPGFLPPDCNPSPQVLDEFRAGAYNYLYVHPPAYYFATAWGAKPFAALGFGLRESARLLSGVWLGAGLLLFWMIAKRQGIPRSGIIPVLLLLATTPAVFHASSIVSNDATALFAGGSVLLAVLSWEGSGRHVWVLPLVAAVAVSLKLTNILAVLIGAAYLGIRAIAPDPDLGTRRRLLPDSLGASVALLAGGLAVMIGWVLLRPTVPDGFVDPMQQLFGVESLSAWDLVRVVPQLITPIQHAWLGPFVDTTPIRVVTEVVSALFLGGGVVAALHRSRVRRMRWLAIGTLAAFAAAAVILTLGNYLFQGVFLDPIPRRYGLSALPAMGLLLASAMTRTGVVAVAWVLAAGASALLIASVLPFV